jgi:hypothetical protein
MLRLSAFQCAFKRAKSLASSLCPYQSWYSTSSRLESRIPWLQGSLGASRWGWHPPAAGAPDPERFLRCQVASHRLDARRRLYPNCARGSSVVPLYIGVRHPRRRRDQQEVDVSRLPRTLPQR